jgi:hypothetical protein
MSLAEDTLSDAANAGDAICMGNILNIKVSNAKTITAINNFLILVVVLVFHNYPPNLC